ncbi:hypothetical protein NG827_14945 [Xanthomonas sacchari]|uniref:hypothetical protein n=1 Tax=Xanthomonas sacchari TaxID=56458 RepID=UPI002258CEB6|nr:hypothetical protein [Xanthomonas sacchari]UYK83754.1 hypothetical protein NG827_14945 [Xanthomonas sacchari]
MNDVKHKIEEAKEEAYRYLRNLADVNGVGTTWHEEHCREAIQINLVTAPSKELPQEFNGFPVVYRIIGEIDIENW